MTCLLKGKATSYRQDDYAFSLRKVSFIFLLLFSCFLPPLFAQQITISGRVTSADSTLANVTVQVKGTLIATQTNEHGRYSLSAPGNASLVFSFVGFAPYEIKVNDRAVINVQLQSSGLQLNDVVVVGYGRQRAPTVTGAVGTISAKELTQTPVSNITNMLLGRTSGISGVQVSGEPGVNAATIRIRGIATLNGADPLIVIDGIQQPTEQPYVLLNAMDANEIESISVLKDASATAVFGIRGANGVLVITTKRGRANRPQFSFSANQGFTKATAMYETASSYEFALMRNEAVRNAQATGDFSFDRLLFSEAELWKFQNNRDYTPEQVNAMTNLTPAQREALMNSPALYYTNNNYYREQFGGTGLQSQYNLNVSGGTAKVRYFTSLGYFNQDGILSNTSFGGANTNPNYKRYNFRSNLDIEVIKNFQLSFNIGGQSSVNRIAGGVGGDINPGNRYQGIIQNILENAPYVGPGIRDGKLITGFIGTTGDTINPLVNKGGTGFTPIASLLTGGSRKIHTTSLNTVVTLRHTMGYLTKGLESHVRLSYDNSYTKGFTQTNRIPTYSAMRNPANPADIVYIGGVIEPNAAADNQGNSSWRKVYLEAAINYRRSFGPHSVSGMVLANAQRYTQNNQAFNTASGLMGLVGRVTYDFKERYLAEFNMGYNGTENFAPGKRFGSFPAVSAGWIVSNEPFFKENKWITFVKLRGSYGEVGNDQIGGSRYLYLPNTWVTNASGYWFGNSNGSALNPSFSGAAESALGNPVITWERAKKTNVSADLKFF
ncbi:MAG TPA: SusC/RagA family TonB-linked outer membrane protein, partial [Flavitalea sp.]|nr:SusC/RagA family TonB-linked outer membrane protein [Flavitalea sp.]